MLDKPTKVFLQKIILKSDNGKCLLSQSMLENMLSVKEDLKKHLLQLEKEGYLDVIYTDRHGEPFVYIVLKSKSFDLQLEKRRTGKELLFRFILALASAVVTYAFGRILYLVFS